MAKRQKYTLDDGREMIFSTEKFRDALYKYQLRMRKDGVKLSREKLIEKLSEDCNASSASMFHWVKGHNGPSDLEKVENLANALGVKTEDLLETENEASEEKNDMSNIITENKIDYATTKEVLREIYRKTVDYIETYRMACCVESKIEINDLGNLFIDLYKSLMKGKLDLPKSLFDELQDFLINYVQLMGCDVAFERKLIDDFDLDDIDDDNIENYWKNFEPIYGEPIEAPYYYDVLHIEVNWSGDSKYYNFFEEAFKRNYNFYEDGIECFVKEFIISRKAYALLDEILKDYMPD